jgi:hypothetical protein
MPRIRDLGLSSIPRRNAQPFRYVMTDGPCGATDIECEPHSDCDPRSEDCGTSVCGATDQPTNDCDEHGHKKHAAGLTPAAIAQLKQQLHHHIHV